jgi:ribosomal protein S18 acetylase RimI-like enzyme
MSAQTYLIDTNVFIGLEDSREVHPEFSSLLSLASKHNVGILVHEAARDDIARDRDAARRRISLSKFAKFQSVAKVRGLTTSQLTADFGSLPKPNDVVDATLLHALRIGVADFLVTEDSGLHDRARRHSPELVRRVLYVADAVTLLRTTYDPIDVSLRYVEEVEAHTIPANDPIFDSLRDGYPKFDNWWRDKCVRQRRPCWVVIDNDGVAGIVVRKEETAGDTDATTQGERILKVCTFKVRPERRGVKLGELLLKQVLWFAQVNRFDVVYLTTFPDQSTLIALVQYYGFVETGADLKGELMFEKTLSREPLPADLGNDLFALACQHYPRFCAGPTVEAYAIPIMEEYHEALFPELKDRTQQDLFEFIGGGTSGGPRRPGNTIRKVYLCRAQAKIEQPGALLFFYKGKSRLPPSQALTSVGIFEDMKLARSIDDLRRLTGGRSVYSERQLLEWDASADHPVKVIDFLLVGHITPPITIEELLTEGAFNGHPQSIVRLSPDRLAPVIARLDLGFAVR